MSQWHGDPSSWLRRGHPSGMAATQSPPKPTNSPMTPPQHQNPWGNHPTAPVSPPRIHPGRWLCPSQPAPAAPAAAPWPCLCRAVSHCRGAEQPRVPPLSPALPAPHSCDGSTSTARPRGAEVDRAPPGSPRVQKTAGSHQTPDTRHRGCGHLPGLGKGKLRHRGGTGRLWWSCPPPEEVPGPCRCPVPTSAPRATLVWHGAGLAPWVGKHLEPSHPKLAQTPNHSAPTQRRGRGGSRAALSPSSPFARARAGPSQPPSPPGTRPPPALGMGPGSCAKASCTPRLLSRLRG